MNRLILIIAAIAAGYAVGKRCARPRRDDDPRCFEYYHKRGIPVNMAYSPFVQEWI